MDFLLEDINYLTEATYSPKITEYDKQFTDIERFIKRAKRIVLFAHISLDSDAINSTETLATAIRTKYRTKEVIVQTEKHKPINFFDGVNESDLLFIFLDVSTFTRISRDKNVIDRVSKSYKGYSSSIPSIRIDHHTSNGVDLPIRTDICIEDINASSTCELIVLFLANKDYTITKDMAKNLFKGIISDSGRFQYSLTKTALIASAILTEIGVDYKDVYNQMYLKSPQYLRGKEYVLTKKKVSTNGVTYLLVNNQRAKEMDFNRGEAAAMVHELGHDRSSRIWVIGNETHSHINCRVRSRDIDIVPICRQFGGGGHENACGVQVKSREEFAQLVYLLDKLLSNTSRKY